MAIAFLCALLALGAIGVFLLHASYYSFWVYDDAFITFRYARNLSKYGVLEYNLGERIEGYSNLLWTLQLACVERLGWPMLNAARAMGIGCAIALFLGVVAFYKDWVRSLSAGRRLARLIGVGLLAAAFASSNLLAAHAQSGLETVQHAALLGCAFLIAGWARRHDDPRALAAAAGLMSLAVISRPEGFGYYPFFVAAALVGPRPRRFVMRHGAWLAIPLVVIVGITLWRHEAYGRLLPLTVTAKQTLAQRGLTGLRDIGLFLTYGAGALPVWILAAIGFIMGRRILRARGSVVSRIDQALVAPVLLVIANFMFVAIVGGDILGFSRFLVPSIMPLALIIAIAAARCAEHIRMARRPAVRRLAGIKLILICAATLSISAGQAFNLFHGVDFFTRQASASPKVEVRKHTAKIVREGGLLDAMAYRPEYGGLLIPFWLNNVMPGQTVVLGDIGLAGWLGEQVRIIDTSGLVCEPFARLAGARPGSAAFDQCVRDVFAMLDAARPEWLILADGASDEPRLGSNMKLSEWPGAREYTGVLRHVDLGEDPTSAEPSRRITILRRNDVAVPDPHGVGMNYARFRQTYAHNAAAVAIYDDWARNADAAPPGRVVSLSAERPEANRIQTADGQLIGERILWSFESAAVGEAAPDLLGWRRPEGSPDQGLEDWLNPTSNGPAQGYVGARLLDSRAGKPANGAGVGEALSPSFTARPGDVLAFLIGGGAGPGTGVVLEADGRAVRRWHGPLGARLWPRWVDLTPYAGRELRLRIMDHDRDAFDYVLADHFVILRTENSQGLAP